MSIIAVSKEALKAGICRDSFYEFVKEFWDTVIPEEPVWNWHIKYLCDELQILAERVFRNEAKAYDLIINIPPGSTKSTICSVMFPAWVWTRLASARLICGSYTSPLALDLSRKSRLIVNSEKYRQLFPEIELSDDQATKSLYTNTANGGRLATMVGGAVTGFHAHFIIVDDPLNPKKAASDADLKSANDWMRETLPTRKVDKKVAPTILIMQRLHQNDPTGNWLERLKKDPESGTIKHINLPAELNDQVSPKEVIPKYEENDGLLDPIRLSKDILREQEAALGPYGYAGQYEQRPVPRGGGAFKPERIIVETTPPRNFVMRVRYWDKAGSRGEGAYTAGVLIGKDRHGYFWVLDVKRGQWDAQERNQIIRQTAAMDGEAVYVYTEQEPGSGGKESAQITIRELAGYKVYAERPVGDKELRAEPFAIQVNGGNVKMLQAAWNYAYTEELQYFPHSTYKDQVDASGGAFAQVNKVKKKRGAL